MTITYYRKQVYGNTLLYIADKKQAKCFEKLTGRKSITANDIVNCLKLFAPIKFAEVIESEKDYMLKD